jgi:phosphotransferase system enzyme I (PtsP)
MVKPAASRQRDHTKLICDIGELSGLFSDATSLETFLQRIVEMISIHMHSEVCSIYIYYDNTQSLVLKATKGLNPQAIGRVKLRLGEGLTGIALKEMRPVCEKNASQSPGYRYFPDIGEEKYESFLAVPIVRGTSRIGVMVIQNSQKDYFNEDDIKVFRAITSQLANTIEMAKLLIGFNEKYTLPLSSNKQLHELKFIKGRVGSEGFAFADAIVYEPSSLLMQAFRGAVPSGLTMEAFYQAVQTTEKQLEVLQQHIEEKLFDVASLIFTAQILMLKDQTFIETMVKAIKEGMNPVHAVCEVVGQYVAMFENLPNPYLQEKKHDVLDIGTRILDNLIGINDSRQGFAGKILISQRLFPSDILKFSSLEVKGLILLSGGITSHLSILARSLGIPVVISETSELLSLTPDTKILLDAEQGNIYVNPSLEVVESFQTKERERLRSTQLKGYLKPETNTQDGTRVKLLANINLLGDLKIACEYKAEGIGLYRSEFPFIVRSNFPSEEEQYLIYAKLVAAMPGKEMTFRTLDIGGDKVLSYYDDGKEENPFLGMRSIRFSLRHKDVFAQQLRAILRASVGVDLRMMFPMISSLDEFREAKGLVLQCVKNLMAEGSACHPSPQIGLMIELPAVLEILDELAAEADFFSIGTNDFIQYLLAVDRTNEKVADLYLPHHPSVLRALKKVVQAAQRHHKEISVCGDMAHQERFIPYLLGIGLRKFSVDSHYLYRIQQAIESIHIQAAEQQTQQLLSQKTICETENILYKSETLTP